MSGSARHGTPTTKIRVNNMDRSHGVSMPLNQIGLKFPELMFAKSPAILSRIRFDSGVLPPDMLEVVTFQA